MNTTKFPNGVTAYNIASLIPESQQQNYQMLYYVW